LFLLSSGASGHITVVSSFAKRANPKAILLHSEGEEAASQGLNRKSAFHHLTREQLMQIFSSEALSVVEIGRLVVV
jgi:cysteine synthase